MSQNQKRRVRYRKIDLLQRQLTNHLRQLMIHYRANGETSRFYVVARAQFWINNHFDAVLEYVNNVMLKRDIKDPLLLDYADAQRLNKLKLEALRDFEAILDDVARSK